MATKKTEIDFEGLFPNPDAQFRSKEFKGIPISLALAISLRKEAIYQIGFETDAPVSFKHIVSKLCALFVGKTKEEGESLSFGACISSLSISPTEHEHALYAWTVLQDTISKLPSPDPFDRAVKKISRLNSEFPRSSDSTEFED